MGGLEHERKIGWEEAHPMCKEAYRQTETRIQTPGLGRERGLEYEIFGESGAPIV